MKYFSPSTLGFYALETNAGFIPEDAVEIEDALHANMMTGQAQGRQIVAGKDGLPALADPPPPSDAELIAQCKATARQLLSDTDYTQAGDVLALIKNADEFAAYRETIRELFRNPVKAPEWPDVPHPDWG